MKIQLSSILTPTFNSRTVKTSAAQLDKEAHALAGLGQSMLAEGQLQPIEVELTDTPGRHLLVFGSRRCAAATAIGWKEIDATVRPKSSANERAIRNGLENLKRQNLNSYEVSRMCASMRDMGMKDAEISQKMAIATTTVSNLAVTYRRLPEPILKEWSEENPVATDRFLRELATEKDYPTATDIMRAWDERVAEAAAALAATGKQPGKRGKARAEGGEGKDTEEDGKGSGGMPVSKARVTYLVDILTAANCPKLNGKMLAFAQELVSFIIMAKEELPVGIPPMPVKAAPVVLTPHQREANKAAKLAEKEAAKAANKAEREEIAAKVKAAKEKIIAEAKAGK